ncbi:MAG: DedA family protein, partial [Solirubrobacteraceae bacterium]|nr:DedA family protein [Solirubrobacteraceae bacterium]
MLIPVSPSIGLPALAALVLGESAGLPIPGETALIVAGGLAAAGHLSLPAVIAVAAISAIIGDMIGYTVGRRGGRKLLLREGRFSAHRRAAVAKADKYFEKYGVITVFFARFVPGVRVVGAVAAGTTQMRFRSFAIANALGCITWATTVASIAYAVGPSGAVVMIVVGFSIAGIGILSAWWKARQTRKLEAETGTEITDPLEALASFATVAEREAEHLIGADRDHIRSARAAAEPTGPRTPGSKAPAKPGAPA